MDPFDQLGLIAEIAAALLGFLAVFIALSNKEGRFAESDRHFIQALVLCASLTIVLSLAPRSISLFVDNELVWHRSAFLAVVLGALIMGLQVRFQLKMSKEEAAQIHFIWHFGAWGLGAGVSVLFILAVLNPDAATAYYVGGTTLGIPLCLWVFIGVVYRRLF